MSFPESVSITTGARLHLGLLCTAPETPWNFGGIGFMVRSPGWALRLRPSPDRDVPGVSGKLGTRIEGILERWRHYSGHPSSYVHVDVCSELPLHAGFGAGTQLTLALVFGAELLMRRSVPADHVELSREFGRSRRSAIGTEGFRQGGFLIDRGVVNPSTADHEVTRIPLPEEWRFVLVRPGAAEGISGAAETSFFDRKRVMTAAQVHTLTEVIDGQISPAVAQADFSAFAEGVQRFGSEIGRFYAAEQGGIFSNALIGEVAEWLTSEDMPGAAQSSWGPGICIPAPDDVRAAEIEQRLQQRFGGAGLIVTVTEPLNHGAVLRTIAPEDQRRYC
jgi:beta-ribofuranosylaminobenzene 5'-phosphate synthase